MKTNKSRVFIASITLAAVVAGLPLSTLSHSTGTRRGSSESRATAPSVAVTVTVVNSIPVPTAFSLAQNFPNPFNQETVIEYTLPKNCHVELTIINILGQKVRTLLSQWQGTGRREVVWDGADDAGEIVASGVYFYQMTADTYVSVKKMIVMK